MQFKIFLYFFKYIFGSKNRQKLIFLAVFGLLISSFSLTVLQGVMGGLQNGLVERSKKVLGEGVINVGDLSSEATASLQEGLNHFNIPFVSELELELMIQNEKFVYPTIVHGLDYNKYVPPFLQNRDKTHMVLGSELGRRLRGFFGSKLTLTSPAHTDFIFREIPRQSVSAISDFYSSELPEIDSLHSWVRISFLQNLIRELKINKLRYYGSSKVVKEYLASTHQNELLQTWEDEHATLVWALSLETNVMLILFVGMSFLIGICITSGFLIFFNKVKIDLTSFWILGLSKKKVLKLIYHFGHLISFLFCFLGVALGSGFLWLIKHNNIVIMPDEFIERNLPVHFSFTQLILSFFVPYLFALFFTHFTFHTFKRENQSFISIMKKIIS